MRKRLEYKVNKDTLESTQFKNLLTAMVNKVSGQRCQLVQSQFESMVPVIGSESPLTESNMVQDILTRSSCIKKARGKIVVLAKFKYYDLTYYIYQHNDNPIDILMDTKYVENNGFATRMFTDLDKLEIGKEYDVNDEDSNFLIKYPDMYKPETDTVTYGANVNTIISTENENVLDSVAVSRRFLEKFSTIRSKTVNIYLHKKKIISKYPNIFPKEGEYINSPMLFKIVKDDNTIASLAQDPNTPSGYEEDSINLEPCTFINRIEVYCNNPIVNEPILEKYRLELLEFRRQVVDFVSGIKTPISDELTVIKSNFMHTKFRKDLVDLASPLIKIYTKTLSLADTETKFNVDPVHGNMCLKSELKAGIA